MSEAVVVFDDFTGGEFGDKGAHVAAPNEWTGSNVFVHQDGTIGPRPGLKGHVIAGIPAGTLWCLAYIGFPTRALLVVIDDGIYYVDEDGDGTMTAADTLDAEPTELCQVAFYDPNGSVYLTSPGGKTYEIDWPTGTATSFQVAAADHGFRGIRLYRDRLYFFDDATSPASSNPSWRVYFSEPADFTNFPPVNQFDVGYFWDLYAALPIANHLYFAQRQTGWWALVGGSPATLTLRQLRTDPPAFGASDGGSQQGYVVENNQIWYFAPGERLAMTNGAAFDEKSKRHLQLGPFSEKLGLYLANDGQDVFFADTDNDDALVRHWGVWCYARYPENTIDGQLCINEFKNRVILAGPPDEDGKPVFYSQDLALNRPGYLDDDYARPGDLSDTPLDAYFLTCQWRDRQDRDFRIRQVIVDYVKFNWAGDSTPADPIYNRIDFEGRTFNRANVAGGDSDSYHYWVDTWEEDAELADVAGTEDRVRFNGGEHHGGAFQIKLGLVGVNVKKIAVVVEYAEGRKQR